MVGSDVGPQAVGEPAYHPLQLVVVELERVEGDTTLGASERDVAERRLPGHPGGQRLYLVQVDHGVESDPTLVGPEQVVVLDPVTAEHPELAVVHPDREVDDDLVLRLGED